MATPRQFSSYDPALAVLFKTAQERPIELKFPTQFDAKRQRKQLYAYRDAIAFAKDAPNDLKLIAKMLSFQVKGNILIVYRPRHLKLEIAALEEAKAQASRKASG